MMIESKPPPDQKQDITDRHRMAIMQDPNVSDQARADAFESLYQDHYSSITGYAKSIVRHSEIAEDAANETFLRLWKNPTGYKHLANGKPFMSWLFRVTHNVAVDMIRSNRLVPVDEVYGPDAKSSSPNPLDHLITQETIAEIMQLESPNPNPATLPWGRLLIGREMGMSSSEEARTFGVTQSAIYGQRHRADAFLRQAQDISEAA